MAVARTPNQVPNKNCDLDQIWGDLKGGIEEVRLKMCFFSLYIVRYWARISVRRLCI